jgi:hypothetical protein
MRKSGPIPLVPGDTWADIDMALIVGLRGLPGRDTLRRLLARERGVRNRKSPPSLTVAQLLCWGNAHRQRAGEWPTYRSGSIPEAGGESWSQINWALAKGKRGLPGNTSLRKLFREMSGQRQ